MLSYEIYDKTRLVIRGDKATYTNVMKKIGARWNSKAHGGEGWLLSRSKEDSIKELVETMQEKKESVKLRSLLLRSLLRRSLSRRSLSRRSLTRRSLTRRSLSRRSLSRRSLTRRSLTRRKN